MSTVNHQASLTTPSIVSSLSNIRFVGFFIALVVLFKLYENTLWSMVRIWNESETFAHGFLIAPIALYIIFGLKDELARIPANTNWFALVLIAGAACCWWIATVVDVQVVQQLTLIALIQCVVLLFFGLRVSWRISFPLIFLYLAVPFGNGLIPHMIDLTADFVVFAIRVVGIPVYREGTFFILPTGSWSVVSGCSGMRYLMATITVGLLFAYMNYRSFKRRLAFMVVACIFALIANWLRAFGIVMIAHYSGMKLALGVDHYVYGWVFFGIIVFFLFWLGQFWQEPEVATENTAGAVQSPLRHTAKPVEIFTVLAVGILCMSLGPQLANRSSVENIAANSGPELRTALNETGWIPTDSRKVDWVPEYYGYRTLLRQEFLSGNDRVGLFVAWYPRQSQDAELVNARNRLAWEKDPVWKTRRYGSFFVGGDTGIERASEATLTSANERLLIWQWYWVGGRSTNKPIIAKLYQALGEITGIGSGGAGIVLYTYLDRDGNSLDGGREVLRRFLGSSGEKLSAELLKSLAPSN